MLIRTIRASSNKIQSPLKMLNMKKDNKSYIIRWREEPKEDEKP